MKFNKIWLVVLILALSLLVRFWKMEYIPFQNDGDEMAYVLAGQSLVEKHIPISWSSFFYEGPLVYDHIYLGDPYKAINYFILIKPWFDHPPLLPLVQGAWSELLGYRFPSMPPSLVFRLPMLTLSLVTLWLVYLLSRHWFGFYPALFSLSLLAFSPAFIFGQRLAVGENLFIPLTLLLIYLTVKGRGLIWLIILTVLIGLTKVTGLVALGLVAFYLLLSRQYRRAVIYTVLSVTSFVLIYALYGYLIDWPQFVAVLELQSRRFIGLANPVNLLVRPGFINWQGLNRDWLYDFSYYLIFILGLSGLFLSAGKARRFLLAAVFGTWLTIWLSSEEFSGLNWYKLPLFVWLAITAGGIAKVKAWWPTLLLLTITVINNFGLIRNVVHPRPEGWQLRLLLMIIFGGLLALLLNERLKKRLTGTLMVVVFLVYAASALLISDRYYETACKDQSCPLPLKTSREWLWPKN